MDTPNVVKEALGSRLSELEKHLNADVAFYYGPIEVPLIRRFRIFIETIVNEKKHDGKLVFILNTGGGSVEVAEKLVTMMRYHYSDVSFVVPDIAMSAGTVLCMSGDRIYMDYSSSLGPIDPQVYNGKEWVPALGYLDKVEELIKKSANNTLTNAEFLILRDQDLAKLAHLEQAKNLTRDLLTKWLVTYKFKDWTKHRSDCAKKGQSVTTEEKENRAKEIAKKLGDNRIWHSHGRMIDPDALKRELKLEIDDYTKDEILRPLIRSYNDLIIDFIARNNYSSFLHNRNFF